jgi:diguanylate cyclase (GGDEF)-like protein
MGWRIRSAALALLLCGAWTGSRAAPVEIAYSGVIVARGTSTVSDIAAGRLDSKLSASVGEGAVAFDPRNELWIVVRVRNPAAEGRSYRLQVRQTSLDELVLFEQQGEQWRASRAGDLVAQSQWAVPGRFARFDLRLEPRETRKVFLLVRNSAPAPVPLQLAPESAADVWTARADFGLAFAFGALAFLAVASFIQAAIYSDRSYFIYGGYALLLALALASIAGVADQLLWGEYPAWSDTAKSVFPLAAAGVSVWLVQALCKTRTRSLALARAAAAAGASVVAVALGFALTQSVSKPLLAAAMFVAASAVLVVAAWTWRRGDEMGVWVAAAHVPIIATSALIVLRMYGVEPLPFRANVLVSLSMGFILLLMLVALVRRSKELLAVRIRAQGMESVDPLTGMLSARLFGDRVRAAVLRLGRSRHDAAVIHVRLANFDAVRKRHGLAVAEQSIIRAAMKLQRVMHEADCFGRVGESTMGLIIETVTRRDALLERASRLVAHGLMPLPGLKPEITLVLHVAVGVLSENPHDAEKVQQALRAQLDAMAVRTRRPIRFVQERQSADSDRASPEAVSAVPAGQVSAATP